MAPMVATRIARGHSRARSHAWGDRAGTRGETGTIGAPRGDLRGRMGARAGTDGDRPARAARVARRGAAAGIPDRAATSLRRFGRSLRRPGSGDSLRPDDLATVRRGGDGRRRPPRAWI